MKVSNRCYSSALAPVIAFIVVFSILPFLFAAEPWIRNNDGSVTVDGKQYPSMQDYLISDEFVASGRRCGTLPPIPNLHGLAIPTDCGISLSNNLDLYLTGQIYEIPVVVHIIHKSDGRGNITDEAVLSQIEILNEDFGALVGTPGAPGSDGGIRFVLASVDPSGAATTGINRTENDNWFNDVGEFEYKTALGWDQTRYLNIYTNSASGYLGYAYLPQDMAGTVWDGVVIYYDAFGRNSLSFPYDQGRTATHEIGHYLGLYHTFEEGCASAVVPSCYSSGDLICDTPSEESDTYGCPVGQISCASLDPIHNYMDYTDDACMHKFTPEQGARMRCSLESYRLSLYTVGHARAPDRPGLLTPDGDTPGPAPTYTWNPSTGAGSYQLWVNDSTGNVINTVYTAAQTDCAGGTGVCSITPATHLAVGSARWWVRARNYNGSGDWSTSLDFRVTAGIPSAPVPVSPQGDTPGITPAYTWNASSGATSYQLWVNAGTGNAVNTVYTAAQTGCAGGTGTCSITPTTHLAPGPARWWVRAWNVNCFSDWSTPLDFRVTAGIPSAPVLISPQGDTPDTTPTYTWNASSGAITYQLWVNAVTGNAVNTVYTAVQTGCAEGTGTCSITPKTHLTAGSARWWVRASNGHGTGGWSAPLNFEVTAGIPSAPALVSPQGDTPDTTPPYTWNASSGATSYQLWVNDTSGNAINTVYTSEQTGCAGGTGTCSITPTTHLTAGSARWWVRASNGNGAGDWSAPLNFVVTVP